VKDTDYMCVLVLKRVGMKRSCLMYDCVPLSCLSSLGTKAVHR